AVDPPTGAPTVRVPADVDVSAREVIVVEVDDDRIAVRESFLHLTVDRLLAGGGRTHRLSFDEVTARTDDLGPAPDALLLHTGRCGSSLLAAGLRGLGWATLPEPLAVSGALTIEDAAA